MKPQLLIYIILVLHFYACKKTIVVGDNKGPQSAVSTKAADGTEGEGEGTGEGEGEGAGEGEGEGAGEGEGEITEGGAGEPSGSQERFNLVKFIQSRTEPELEELKKKLDPEGTKLAIGDRGKFALESNMTLGLTEGNMEAGEERKLDGTFWMRGFMFDKQIKNIDSESDLITDVGANATLDKLSMEAFFRYLGVDVATKTITAGFDQAFTRDNEIKMGANVVVVGAEVSLRMGGEVGLKAEFGIRKDNVLNLVFAPRANITAGVGGDIKLLGGVGTAGAEGVITMMKLVARGNANLGLVKNSKIIYGDIGVDGGQMDFTDGKVDLVAKSLGRVLWRKNVYDPQPLVVKQVPQYGSTIVKFLGETFGPACQTAAEEAKKILDNNKLKLTKYSEAVAEEDKPVVLSSIRRMGEIQEKIEKGCAG